MTRQRRRLPPLVAAAILSLAGGTAALAQQAPSPGTAAETRQILAQAQTAGDRRALGNVIGGPAQTAAGPATQQPTAATSAPAATPASPERAATPAPPSPGFSTAPGIEGAGTPQNPRVIVRMPPQTAPATNAPSPPAQAVQIPTAAQGAPVATVQTTPRQAPVPLRAPPRQFGSQPVAGSQTVFVDLRTGQPVPLPHADAGWCPPGRW